MNTESRKLELISWISSLSNEELLEKIEFLKKSDKNWWDILPDEIKKKIEASEKEFNEGISIEHDQQINKLNKLI